MPETKEMTSQPHDPRNLMYISSSLIRGPVAQQGDIRILVCVGQDLFMPTEQSCLFTLPDQERQSLANMADEVLCLGEVSGSLCLALCFADSQSAPERFVGALHNLRNVWRLLPREEASLAAYARGLYHWHRTHRHCGRCGSTTASVRNGQERLCNNPDCSAAHFPRTDPAVIMRITDGDWCLLARNARWRNGMYSVLAGFVEIGESLEQAVVRETCEEVGIALQSVSYFASQPWPFPSSLMVGFCATADRHQPLSIDPHEIEDARWFHRNDLLEAHHKEQKGEVETHPLRLSSQDSISRELINDWLFSQP